MMILLLCLLAGLHVLALNSNRNLLSGRAAVSKIPPKNSPKTRPRSLQSKISPQLRQAASIQVKSQSQGKSSTSPVASTPAVARPAVSGQVSIKSSLNKAATAPVPSAKTGLSTQQSFARTATPSGASKGKQSPPPPQRNQAIPSKPAVNSKPQGVLPPEPKKNSSLVFGLGSFAFSLLPLSPESLGRRKTLQSEVVKGKIWTFDQLQGIINVNVPVRSTIVKLKDGLFVHNPVGPTAEYISMVRALEKEHGPVKYIVLATLGLEHKGTAGAFSGYFPEATVYLQPGQYSVPVNLPSFFFFPLSKSLNNKLKEIPLKSSEAPWGAEIDHAVLGPLLPPGRGGYSETAFYHKETKTLIVTDAIVKVPDDPPAIIQEDPRALLYHARQNMTDFVYDSPEARRRGWRRMVLFGLTFQPSGIRIFDTLDAIKMLDLVPKEMRALGRGTIPISEGLYPWEWVNDETPSFKALQGGLLVAPILQLLIFNREPEAVLNWADKVAKWDIKRIIPCHLENDLKATGKDFRRAFNFLEEPKRFEAPAPRALEADAQVLLNVSRSLTQQEQIFPPRPLLKR